VAIGAQRSDDDLEFTTTTDNLTPEAFEIIRHSWLLVSR
jgi:hypothetical protein